MRSRTLFAATVAALMAMSATAASPRTVPGSPCSAPARVEPKSGRSFLLDYPCDLKPDEKLTFILLLHGAGSLDVWARAYFPAVDYKEKYRLVIATPGAGSENRIWNARVDDGFLQDVAESVFAQFGRSNIKRFWLAGHSQGGITATRIVCNDYFQSRVDGLLSLSGGRIGPTQLAPDFFDPPPGGTPPGATPPPVRRPGAGATENAAPPTCDFSYIYAVGEHEILGLPESSPWRQKYGCGARVRRPDVVDDRGGYVTGAGQPRKASYGQLARPGVAQVMIYPDCNGGRLVADVMRLDKGHTEGLEPKVTEQIVQLMLATPGR